MSRSSWLLFLFSGMALGVSSESFAYHSFSRGLGFDCRISYEVLPQVATNCVAHIVSEAQVLSGIDVNYQEFRSVQRVLDNSNCFSGGGNYQLSSFLGDVSNFSLGGAAQVAHTFPDPTFVSAVSTPVIDGFRDRVERDKVLTYYSYLPETQASQEDQEKIMAFVQRDFESAKFLYDAQGKTFFMTVVAHGREQSRQFPANFSKNMNIKPLSFKFLEIPAEPTLEGRKVSASVSCAAN